MAFILKGKPVADEIYRKLEERIGRLSEKNIIPCLAIVRVGNDESAEAYESSVLKAFSKRGLAVKSCVMPDNSTEAELTEVLREISGDKKVHGCMIMRPLPRHMDENRVLQCLSYEKDVDCVSRQALGGVFSGDKDCFAPCTAQACMEILDYYNVPLKGKRAAVIGRSLVVGKPLSVMLTGRDATVTMCHSRTLNTAEICAQQDIIIAAAGREKLVDKSYTNEHQYIIDVGINVGSDGKIHGDVDFEAVEPAVSAVSPVPGGVGSVTTAVLAEHLVTAAERQLS